MRTIIAAGGIDVDRRLKLGELALQHRACAQQQHQHPKPNDSQYY
jgi:hypothetical protein